jgi:hypothetical protein
VHPGNANRASVGSVEERGKGELRDLEERLRAASDAIQLMVAQLSALETQKRRIEPSDERFVELAALVRRTATELLELATAEETFARELSPQPSTVELPRIEEVPPRRDLRQILEEWRDVERQLTSVDPGSSEAVALVERFEHLRAEYARATAAKREDQNGQAASR